MAVVRLKGLNSKSKRLSDGRRVTYWYAWKGGPRLPGNPGSPEFLAAYNAAVADRRAPKKETLADLVGRYRAAPEFTGLGESTRAEWSRWLKRIEADEAELDVGGLPLALLDDRRARADLLEWRDQWGDRPRTADYAMQVLSRVLAFGVDRGLLAINVVAGVSQLYESDRGDQIWTPDEIARFAAAASSPEVALALKLACVTGLRRSDLIRAAWSHVSDVAIVVPTLKSRKGAGRERKSQVIPILPETKALLDQARELQAQRHARNVEIAKREKRPPPPQPTTILSNTRSKPWSADGLENRIVKAKTAAGIDKHLHDARGTFATRLRAAGLKASEIADVLGWEEERVERLLATYVDRETIVRSIADRLNRPKE